LAEFQANRSLTTETALDVALERDRNLSSSRWPFLLADDGCGKPAKIIEVAGTDCEHNGPVDPIVVVHRDVAETDCAAQSSGEFSAYDSESRQRAEYFAQCVGGHRVGVAQLS
jgi:hypothetical protein